MIIGRDGRVVEGEVELSKLGFRFEMALLYAFRLHAGQVRKGSGTPYVGHLLGVAALVIESGGDEDEAIAALLHDAVEDQGGVETLGAIREMFGERVAAMVEHCGDGLPGSPERGSDNWKARKSTYLQGLRQADESVLRVSLADKLYNARTILYDLRALGPGLWDRFHRGKEEQLWYYRGLVEAFRRANHIGPLLPLVGELEMVVAEIGLLAEAEGSGTGSRGERA